LLQAILGELEADSGSIEINGTLSYASQESFVFEGSIRNNILFTEEYNQDKYSKVVSTCGLSKDFELFENGDQTMVGEKGVSLSGGQKARINLARAVYKEANIYLLDDCLSAVDSAVGNTIFNECIMKYLKDKTVLLVTHQLQYLHKLEDVIIISDGFIKASGSYIELKDKEIANLLPIENTENEEEKVDKNFQELTKHINEKHEELESYEEKESQEEGKVSFQVYKNYFKSIKSLPLVILVLSLRVINQFIASFIDFFVAQWVNWEESVASTQIYIPANDTEVITENLSIEETRQNYINIYVIIICVFIVIIIKAEFSFFYAFLR
jgi:ATP-binding cassette, subfamily C (CFTR/MRP), member 4